MSGSKISDGGRKLLAAPSTATNIDSSPPEILLRIFWYIPRVSDDIHTPVPPWAVVLHVCCKWREMSLAYPELWTLIPLGSVQWTELSLHLSQPLPIAIHIPGRGHPLVRHHPSILAAMLHLERAMSLDISTAYATESFRNAVLGAIRDHPPINLVEFSSSPSGSHYPLESLLYDAEISSTLLPEIRRLNVFNCLLPADNLVFPSTLVRLQLDCIKFADRSLACMIDILALLPSLEDLSLSYLRFTESNTADVLNRTYNIRVFLPRIHTLVIRDFADFVLFYMRLLDVPLHPDLSLTCTVTPRGSSPMGFNNPYYAELFPILRRYLTVVSNQPLKMSFPGPLFKSSWHTLCPIVRCDVADMHILIRNQELPDHTVLPFLLPDTACEATLICDAILPQTIWTAVLERTSSYLRRILFTDISQLSSCPLAQAGHDAPSLPDLREIVFTKPQNVAEEKCRSHFPEVLRLLRKTATVIVFEAGTRFEEKQTAKLKGYSGRIKLQATSYKIQVTTINPMKMVRTYGNAHAKALVCGLFTHRIVPLDM